MSFRVKPLWLAPAVLIVGATPARADSRTTPTFARQTGLACSVCHVAFPELTAFGRAFKLNGYNMEGMKTIEDKGPKGQTNLLLNLVAPMSLMMQASYTSTSKAQPGTQNGTALLPQQVSLFTGGEISPKMGAFLQLTYNPESGTFGLDNTSFRFVTHGTVFAKSATMGLSLNDNPTVQDLWNSTPAWRFPYASSSVAPTPAAVALIDGTLAQAVAGLSAYTMWNDAVYAELGAYRSSPLGVVHPLDASASNVIKGVAPYWRFVLPHSFGHNYVALGTYGMSARLFPAGVMGASNRFTDIGIDLSDQLSLGLNTLSAHATWIHEKQSWDTVAANPTNTLDTYRLDAMYHVGQHWGFALAPFVTTGSADSVLYTPAPVTGSAAHMPNSNGIIAEVDVNPWENTRIAFQYVAYGKFNGASSNYDGSGRDASHNNTLYVLVWLLY